MGIIGKWCGRQFVTDINIFINQHQRKDREIILMMDANEEIGINSKGIATLLSECSLTDLLQHRHPTLQTPVTYNRGTKSIDYILGTSHFNEAVERCGILPFYHHIQAEHRAIYIDFHANKLVGGNQHDIAAFKSR